jgi:hypothetical protein
MTKLKPCPFCGSEAKLLYTGEGGSFRASCYNEDCGCQLPPRVIFEKDEDVLERVEQAIKYWNDRHKEPSND